MATARKTLSNHSLADTASTTLLVVKEGTLIGVLVVAVFCLLALASYSPQDPGWSALGEHGRVANAMGSTGAWVADWLFSLFGFSAYIIPAMLLYRSWLIFRDRYTPLRLDAITLGLKLAGAVLLMLGLTCLFSLSSLPDHSALPFGGGGYIGMSLRSGLDSLLNPSGTVLLMLALTLFGMTLFAEVSWLSLMDTLGGWTLQLVAAAAAAIADWWQRGREIAKHRWREKQASREAARQQREQAGQANMFKAGSVLRERDIPRLAAAGPASGDAPAVAPDGGASAARKVIDKVVQGTSALVQRGDPQAKATTKKRSSASLGDMQIPEFELLDTPALDRETGYSEKELHSFSRLLEDKLADFGVSAEVKCVLPGPVITRFEIQPAAGVKVSKISNLVKDLARSLSVISVRVVEVIPGKSYVGIEIPNADRAVVYLSDVLLSETYQDAESPLTLALGHDISGQPIIADLQKMPHLLVAGTTGSGKSVGVNAMLLSLLYKATPAEVRLILIDPKMLELNVYEGIPHLLAPVITDMKDAANGLRWCVAEMERRYRLMASLGVRHLAGFNKKVREGVEKGEPIDDPLWQPDPLSMVDVEDQVAPQLDTLPHIVVVIDEFADMMMIVGKKVEQLIARIAQKARAAGIHLILATQRPSVDVITGLIKANVPTRIAFQVSSRIDSRTILDQGGAEQLLGHGDMLYLAPGSGVPTRVHGAFVSDEEVHRVCDDWRSRAEPDYIPGVTEGTSGEDMGAASDLAEESDDEADELYDEAVYFVTQTRKASISAVQRKLRIGYNRAARMIETMEASGVVSEMQSNGSREVLAPEPS
ncbi:MAG: DNA translocase FtsK 4TM domain-containing protein [Pseudomonadales bacterium]